MAQPAAPSLTTSASDPQQTQQVTDKAKATTTTKNPSTQRTKNTTCYLPVVYGSIAYYLGKKKSDEYNTHEWTLFVRGPNQEDLSPVISKVVFQLHPSFAQPTRELSEPPYEVTERGWGEFEAQIRIHWKDTAQEQSTVVNHTIRLYPPGTPPNMTQSNKTAQTLEKPVLAEIYDEVVFTNPTEDFYESLQQIDQIPKIELASANAAGTTTTTTEASSSANNSQLKKEHVDYYNDEEDFLALVAAQNFLKEELSKVKRRFESVTRETAAADRSITTAAKAAAVQQQSQQRARDAAAAAQAKQAQAKQQAAAGSGGGGSGGKSSGGGTSSSSKKRPLSTSKSGSGKKGSSKKTKTAASSSNNTGAGGTSNAATASNSKSGK